LDRLNLSRGQSSQQNPKPRRGNIFVVRESKLKPSSVRSDICRPAGARLFCGWLTTKISLLTEL
jgi:hypothetical protein